MSYLYKEKYITNSKALRHSVFTLKWIDFSLSIQNTPAAQTSTQPRGTRLSSFVPFVVTSVNVHVAPNIRR